MLTPKKNIYSIVRRLVTLLCLTCFLMFSAYKSADLWARYADLRMYDLYSFSNASLFAKLYLRDNTEQDWWENFKPNSLFAGDFVHIANGYAYSVPVLVYHGIVERPDGFNLDVEAFQSQMVALKKNGWSTVSLEDFDSFLRGEKQLPAKSFLLTFDDGRRDSYYPVDPILEALNFHAVMFVITDRSLKVEGENRGRFHLNENELREMQESGRWDLQSHGHADHDFYSTTIEGKKDAHFLSNFLWRDSDGRIETKEEYVARINLDLAQSKDLLEERFGRDIYSFAFPFGDYGQNTVNNINATSTVLEAVSNYYRRAFYQVWPGQGFPFNEYGSNAFMVKRINVAPDYSGDRLVQLLDLYRDKSLPYSDYFHQDHGWIKNWGGLSFDLNGLQLFPGEGSTGALAFLAGTESWHDYQLGGIFTRSSGIVISMLGLLEDPDNYYECVFGDNFVRLQQKSDGVVKTIQEVKINPGLGNDSLNLGFSTNEHKIFCRVNDKDILSNDVANGGGLHGGIGIKMWSPNSISAGASLRVHSINVK